MQIYTRGYIIFLTYLLLVIDANRLYIHIFELWIHSSNSSKIREVVESILSHNREIKSVAIGYTFPCPFKLFSFPKFLCSSLARDEVLCKVYPFYKV